MSNTPTIDPLKVQKTDYVALVLEADIPTPTMKHLLLTIAALANENGKCRPSITRLAILTGLNRRTITRNLRNLENNLWLYIHRTGTINQKETNFYELNPRKCQVVKVSFEGRGTKPLGKKVGAQDPQSRGTAPPNTNTPTPAPRPTAALQAQAGRSGAGSNVIKEEKENTGTRPLFPEHMNAETKPTKPIPFTKEPVKATTVPVASSNPYKGRKYITRAEHDEATANGISLFDLPEVMDEQEDVKVESLFS
jgi:hypothetical protein